ncbi:kinesin light chain [Xylaria curta]|nr:kinesin light chain [Xylaria curta]
MRLLQRDAGHYSLTPDLISDVPPYAILSHTWGPDEVVFQDLKRSSDGWRQKAGYNKIRFCAKQARKHSLRYFWVDTCCIDKSDGRELQTAINSMFKWYRDAKICYVYLSDVSAKDSDTPWEIAFRNSRWFTRGWTLQELIAPFTVEFYSREGIWLGDKRSLGPQIRDITGIPANALRNTRLSDFTIAEREAWIHNRQTTIEEDMIYSLLGIFGVHMPLIYGEGRQNARRRLQEEVEKATKGTRTHDFSVAFSLSDVPEIQYFVARESEIAEVRRTLSSDGSRRVVVLQGLGGIGKTQLTVAYAKRYRDEYSAIFWLSIKDQSSIQESFTEAAKQILRQHPNAKHLNALNLQHNDEVVNAVKAWLSQPGNTRWLLVYDNYDNPKLGNDTDDATIDINRFLPEAYQGSVIVTTRSPQVNLGHMIRIRKIESMNDGLQILATTSGRHKLDTDVDAKVLVKELDGLPLALASAGAYMRRVSIGFADYHRLYKESWARLHTSAPNLGSYRDRTLCSTWELSYTHIQKEYPLAAHLLRWWAYFDNEDIWFELLRLEGAVDPPWIYELADEINFNKAMGMLQDYGFVEPHISSSDLIESRGYSIHACVHAWSVYVLNSDWDTNLARLSVKCVAERVPPQHDRQYWLLQRRLLSHATVCSAAITDDDDGLAWAFHKLGDLYADKGKLSEAERMYLRALRGKEKVHGPDHELTLDTVNDLGIVYKNQGKLSEAERMYLRALRGKEKVHGPDHESTLDTVNNLGVLYDNQGKLSEAERMYLRALRGKEKIYGPNHVSTLNTVNNLGVLYDNQGKLSEAESIFLRALRGKEKICGPNHVSTLNTVNNLGVLYDNQGKLSEAERMYLRALQGYEKIYGPDHGSTLDTVNNLGDLYTKQNRLPEAEEMLLRARQGYQEAMGLRDVMRHRPAMKNLWCLGDILLSQGKPAEAKILLEQAYTGLEALLGPSHEHVQMLRNTLLDLDETLQIEPQNVRRRDIIKNIPSIFSRKLGNGRSS